MIYQAQPYRQGAREQSQALQAMLAGRPLFMPNPQDQTRQLQRKRVNYGALYALLMAQARR